MESETIIMLRPQDSSLAAHAASLSRLDTAIAANKETVASLIAQRDKIMVIGSGADIDTAVSMLTAAESDQEQLQSLRSIVAARLPILERDEVVAALRASIDEANARTIAADERMRLEYTAAATAMIGPLADLRAAEARRDHCARQWFQFKDLAQAAGISPPVGSGILLRTAAVPHHETILLPGIAPLGDDDSPPAPARYWPPADEPASIRRRN